jgi:hypothetical protein
MNEPTLHQYPSGISSIIISYLIFWLIIIERVNNGNFLLPEKYKKISCRHNKKGGLVKVSPVESN